jgi:DNA polymerase/3'-5' exonuclease PolX
MENKDIAQVFEDLSNLTRILQEDSKWQFKAAAYDRAKRVVESYPQRLEDVARDPHRKLRDWRRLGE